LKDGINLEQKFSIAFSNKTWKSIVIVEIRKSK
jgi:hypothetical protein